MKDHGKEVAIKISKNSENDTSNAQLETRFLSKILASEPDKHRLLKIYDSFFFRQHYLIVTEMLDIDLYSYIKRL